MTKGFLIAICIIIVIALIIFPLIVSYKAQNNKKKKN
jgi:type II secretory pathway pseudopilin PulG|tara:strand:+ start:206 stop:316 length:111 start_codon:yes stop_codon:yes gene_type:complete